MQRYTVYLYLETALHVSGGTSTHHQERIQLYLQHVVFVTPLLLSAAIVEELEMVRVCCGWRTPPTAHSNQLSENMTYFPCIRKRIFTVLTTLSFLSGLVELVGRVAQSV
jgi:hypothetical protein